MRCAALLMVALLLAACAPRAESDCDQLLADENYSKVIQTCEDPAALGMAYLGLAGFDFIDFLAADDPNDIAALLELDASNVALKRELINQAIRELYPVESTKQAFVLLLGGFLGLSVTYSEYLDNGAGGATAFDNDVSGGEVEQATGLAVQDPAPLVPFDLGTSLTYQMVTGGQTAVTDCTTVTAPLCNSPDSIFDDVAPVDGAGLDVTTPSALTNADVTTATVANQIVMLLGLDLPITIDTAKLDKLQSFLGQGTLDENFPEENPDLFPIGVLGYLGIVDLANLALIVGAGGDIENGEPAQSTLNDSVDAIRERLDNGAVCFKGSATDPLKIAAAFPLNLLFAVYQSAPGTVQTDVPGNLDFTAFNIVGPDQLDTDGDGFVDATAGVLVTPDGALYEFGGGALEMGYKVLYPTVIPLGAFDRNQATPRIDQTPSSFQTDFEYLPQLAPNAATLLDGNVLMIEVICSANDA